MTPDEFHQIARFMKRRAGIVLGDGKRALAASKLKSVVARFDFKSIENLVNELTAPSDVLARDVIDALTTNETFFFRDKAVFQYFRNQLFPALLHARLASRRVRIWCAASSTGQEPYSVALIVEEFRSLLKGWTVEILATDIAAGAIARARDGIYSAGEVDRGLPRDMLSKHFHKSGNDWQLDESVRRRVTFATRNLLLPFDDLGTFDIIFCRNLLIFFDAATKQDLLGRMQQSLAPDGHLILGASETLKGFGAALEPVDAARAIYAKAHPGPRRLAAG